LYKVSIYPEFSIDTGRLDIIGESEAKNPSTTIRVSKARSSTVEIVLAKRLEPREGTAIGA